MFGYGCFFRGSCGRRLIGVFGVGAVWGALIMLVTVFCAGLGSEVVIAGCIDSSAVLRCGHGGYLAGDCQLGLVGRFPCNPMQRAAAHR